MRSSPFVLLVPFLALVPALRAADTSLFTIAANGYAISDTNSCAIALNNLVTAGHFQFAAYYTTAQHLVIARRDLNQLGTPTWTTVDTGFAI
ncbi:MAG TPA: hypothetical protein VHM90_11360, partial [Phycisphaerae bacterium]|nr:hypothetical protein [Phycisphaerae bacterium]